MLELHAHTTYSDGTLSPTELVQSAARAGVRALAITDHDTIAGWDEAIATAQTLAQPLEIIPGVELSVTDGERSLHILGFYPDPNHFRPFLAERLAGRRHRAYLMVERLAELGYAIDASLLPGGTGAAPGRPHIAQALVAAGYINHPQEAFDRWIGDGKPAYVPYDQLAVMDGLAALRAAGAIPVWAHPYLWHSPTTVEVMLPDMVAAGLMGLEVYHPTQTPSQQDRLTALCREWGLLKTGGSDYHGPAQDTKHPLNHFNLPLGLLRSLQSHPSLQHSA
ncbi:MAG: PHP domain-containing protein [Cyanothece sp. SIO2G6]|nr:PHP domain-containing protein [Cyanothece sp. SIO2G6]